jgi:hypothetical protein
LADLKGFPVVSETTNGKRSDLFCWATLNAIGRHFGWKPPFFYVAPRHGAPLQITSQQQKTAKFLGALMAERLKITD